MPASSPHDTAVRWRQLVELAARAPADGDRGLIDAAISEIREGLPGVEERVRVAAALAVAPLPLPASLVAAFAQDRLIVAAPVLAGARLTASEWKTVADSASSECRAFISAMRSEPAESMAKPQHRDSDDHPPIPSISEVVARIERLRQSRDVEPTRATEAGEPAEEPRLFRWECNEAGEIDWVDGVPRGVLVGQSISQLGMDAGGRSPVERAFSSRTPFHDAILDLPGESSVGGRWKMSGIPSFERSTGRFAGYRGIAERPDGTAASATNGEANSLRELAHEIRTPLNAIIGFAEIISGEYLGPADDRLRQKATGIVDEARILLSAIEDLDFAARMNSEFAAERPRFHLDELVESMLPAIKDAAGSATQVEFAPGPRHVEVSFHPDLAQRLMLRLCSALFKDAVAGEVLRIRIGEKQHWSRVAISRPEADGRHIETAQLRLASGLAKVGGARLQVASDTAWLDFPRS